MKANMRSHAASIVLAAGLALTAGLTGAFAQDAFVPAAINSSTIPANGDVNPYGVAFVPDGFPGGGSIAAVDDVTNNLLVIRLPHHR